MNCMSHISQAVNDVLTERIRQVAKEGWTPEHDDEHKDGQLAAAAASYAVASTSPGVFHQNFPPALWPWNLQWWKPGDRRRMLVKAGALILAEIERVDRQGGVGTFKVNSTFSSELTRQAYQDLKEEAQQMRDGFAEIYALRGEDTTIAKICNKFLVNY